MNADNVATSGALHVRKVFSAGERPTGPAPWKASMIFARRAWLRLSHAPGQLIGDGIVFPAILTIMFANLLGGTVAGSTSEYVQYLIPGVLTMVLFNISNNVGINMNTDRTNMVFDRFDSMPFWPAAPFVGALLVDVVRYVMASAVVLVIGFLFGFRPAGGFLGIVLALALLLVFTFSASWIWLLFALKMPAPSTVTVASITVILPLSFLSSIFVKVETLPTWLRVFVEVNPVTHVANAVRSVMAGAPDAGEIGWMLAACVVITAIFGTLTVWLYRERAEKS